MDQMLDSQEQVDTTQLLKLKKRISHQYFQSTGKTLLLSDTQIQSIINAHQSAGTLGNLSIEELRAKVKILAEQIPEVEVRRFLLEAGFCGSWRKNIKENIFGGEKKDNTSSLTASSQRPTYEKTFYQSQSAITAQEVKHLLEQSMHNHIRKEELLVKLCNSESGRFKLESINSVDVSIKQLLSNANQKFLSGILGGIRLKDLVEDLISLGFYPAYEIDLDGQKLYLSEKTTLYQRSFVVGYTETGEPRFFYKSLSEGQRRSCDGLTANGEALSKADLITNSSYETTTIVHHDLATLLDRLDSFSLEYDVMKDIRYRYGPYLLHNSLSKEINIDLGDPKNINASDAITNKPTDQVQAFFAQYDPMHISDLEQKIGSYSFDHDLLGEVKVDIIRCLYSKPDPENEFLFLREAIDIHFAHAVNNNPDHIFIIKGELPHAKINSFGLSDYQVNLGTYVVKPIYYKHQLPYNYIKSNPEIQNFATEYYDVRPLFQDMPLIKRYKERQTSQRKKQI